VALSIASDEGVTAASLSDAAGQWGRRFLYAVVLPATVLVVAGAAWYVATGETPTALFHRLTTPPSVTMALPPRPGAAPPASQSGGALLKPPQSVAARESKPVPATGELATVKPSGAALPAKSDIAKPDTVKSVAANEDREEAEAPSAPPPAPARGVMPPGPSPMKPTPLAKVAEMPPPAPPPAPVAAAMPAPATPPASPATPPAPPPAPVAAAMPAPAATAAPAEPAPAAPAPSAPTTTALTPVAPTTPAIAATTAPAAPAEPPPAATPAAAAPQTVATNAPAPPPVNEPQAPPAGEPLAPPSYAQLPARTDLKPLPAAPQADLLRDSPDGPLPITAGPKEARLAYARPFVAGKDKQAKLAITVVGLGLSREAAEAAIAKLPPEVDLSFSPYAGNLDAWVKKARDAGHEVLIDLPLEPPNYPLHDAGPLAVLSKDGPGAAVDRLHQILGKATGYVGVAATLRSPIAGGADWAPMMKELKTRGLILVGDGPAGGAAGETPAIASVTLVPDQTPFRASIDVQLARLLATAQRDGAAVAYVSPRPVSFERLLAWAATLPQKDAVLVPVSALAKTQP